MHTQTYCRQANAMITREATVVHKEEVEEMEETKQRKQQTETLAVIEKEQKPKSKEFNPNRTNAIAGTTTTTVIHIPDATTAAIPKDDITKKTATIATSRTGSTPATITTSASPTTTTLSTNTNADVVLNVYSHLDVATATAAAIAPTSVPASHSYMIPSSPLLYPTSIMSYSMIWPWKRSEKTSVATSTELRTVAATLSLSTLDAGILMKDESMMQSKATDNHHYSRRLPIFIIFISLLEIGVFIYDYMTVQPQMEMSSTSIPNESVLIYRPDRRLEIWRFISYMVLHANWFHLSFNVVIQLLYGVPLEMVHGSMRVAVIYLSGVFAGSLGTSVVDSAVYLVGASGGVYAILAAQLANISLNYGQMRYSVLQLVSVVIFVSCDLAYALYSNYIIEEANMLPAVSYIAHLTGAMAGFTMGLLVLKNFNQNRTQSNLITWLALGVYSAFTIFAIVFNLINTMTAQMLEEEGEVIKQHLLHDLGIS